MMLTPKRSQNGFTIIEGIVAATLVVALFAGTANVLVSMAKEYASTYISDMGETEAEVFRTEFDYAVKNCQQVQIYSSTDSFTAAEAPTSAGNLLVCNMGTNASVTKYLMFWFQPDSPGSATGKLCYGETDITGPPSLPVSYATFHDAMFSPYEAVVPGPYVTTIPASFTIPAQGATVTMTMAAAVPGMISGQSVLITDGVLFINAVIQTVSGTTLTVENVGGSDSGTMNPNSQVYVGKSAQLFSTQVDPTTNQPSGLIQFRYWVNYEREAVSYNGISYTLSMR